ncbi:hypothetical protein XMM354_003294 [Aliiroseovarius sp. xm-m-354]|nr:hypothetical protein [Aliiroseovarius sp. xm-m-354]
MARQRGVVDRGCVADCAVAHGIADDLFDLSRPVAEFLQRGRHRLVDDLKIATTRKFLELHQRKVRLNPRGVAVHHQTDGARGRDDRGLRVAVAMRFAKFQRLVPAGFGNLDQPGLRAIGVIQRHRLDRKLLIPIRFTIGGGAVVADDPQHVIGVLCIAREGPQFTRHLGRGGIGHTSHDRGERAAKGAALVAVIGIAHVHQQPADVRIAQTKRAEVIRPLRDFLGGELRHHHTDLQRHGPEAAGVHVVFNLKLAILEEGQQVHRGQVAGRIVEEHIF